MNYELFHIVQCYTTMKKKESAPYIIIHTELQIVFSVKSQMWNSVHV